MFIFAQERDSWVQSIEQQILTSLQCSDSGREKVGFCTVFIPQYPLIITCTVLFPASSSHDDIATSFWCVSLKISTISYSDW